jgi:hypothetical protein
MRTTVAAMTGLVLLAMVSGAAAQMQPMTPPGGPSSQDPHSHPPVTGPGMMGGMMMCPMMGQGMMGMGPGMMGGMMGASDPKAMARMLKLRGDMMKAMGEVMLKHAQALEQEK